MQPQENKKEMSIISGLKVCQGPDCCGSVDLALSWKLKGRQFEFPVRAYA